MISIENIYLLRICDYFCCDIIHGVRFVIMPRGGCGGNIGRRTRNATDQRNSRVDRTPEERHIQREIDRLRSSQYREQNREEQNEQQRLRRRSDRAQQTNEMRLHRADVERQRYQHRQQPTVNIENAAFQYDPTIDYSAHASLQIGRMSVVCVHCDALKFAKEPPGLCCLNGKVKLPELLPPPEPLHSLLYGQSLFSNHFLHNIKMYNDCFQMTSFGGEIVNERNYNPTFKVISTTSLINITLITLITLIILININYIIIIINYITIIFTHSY